MSVELTINHQIKLAFAERSLHPGNQAQGDASGRMPYCLSVVERGDATVRVVGAYFFFNIMLTLGLTGRPDGYISMFQHLRRRG